jgi:hypothetical protein
LEFASQLVDEVHAARAAEASGSAAALPPVRLEPALEAP